MARIWFEKDTCFAEWNSTDNGVEKDSFDISRDDEIQILSLLSGLSWAFQQMFKDPDYVRREAESGRIEARLFHELGTFDAEKERQVDRVRRVLEMARDRGEVIVLANP